MGLLDKFRNGKMPARPMFSLCHSTARVPDGWQDAKRAWLSRADHPELCEYIVSVDRADYGKVTPVDSCGAKSFQYVINECRQCAVDGWNTAAAAATGQILITVADDWLPPEHWDTLLLDLIQKARAESREIGESAEIVDQHAVWVATGGNYDLMTFSILTKAYYDRYGYIFFPEYIGMHADNDFQMQCERDGVLIDARKLLPIFEHKHPAYGTAANDDIYRRQHRAEAFEIGRRVFASRWPNHPDSWKFGSKPDESARRTIAVCLPGETFSATFLCAWTALLSHMIAKGYIVHTSVNHTSNVYFTRQALAKSLEGISPRPDYVLWIDDDQILTPENFDLLMDDFRREPRADIVAAWTWIQDNMGQMSYVSAGKHTGDEASVTFIPRAEIERLQREGLLVEVEWTGFPAVLMKYEVIARASANAVMRNGVANPFCPIPAPKSVWGFTGEDISFCVNATDAGCHIFVDARVFVPHLKLRAIAPGPHEVAACPAKVEDSHASAALRELGALEYTGV